MGWIAVTREGDGELIDLCAESLAALLDGLPRFDHLAIDIPIGLLEVGMRDCDREARRVLGPRRSSVFPAPIRSILAADSWTEACAARLRAEGKKVSKQAWGIVDKVREVDSLLRVRTDLSARISEVHPELSFLAWNGFSILPGKKEAPGHAERRRLVEEYFGASAYERVRARHLSKHVAKDDILDAFAALWSAERIARGRSVCLPARAPIDAHGLPMTIRY